MDLFPGQCLSELRDGLPDPSRTVLRPTKGVCPLLRAILRCYFCRPVFQKNGHGMAT
jgi:hypothetical protein